MFWAGAVHQKGIVDAPPSTGSQVPGSEGHRQTEQLTGVANNEPRSSKDHDKKLKMRSNDSKMVHGSTAQYDSASRRRAQIMTIFAADIQPKRPNGLGSHLSGR